MKRTFALLTGVGALALGLGGEVALAQGGGIPIRKDVMDTTPARAPAPAPAPAPAVSTTMTTTTNPDVEWKGPLGYSLRPGGSAVYCAPGDSAEVAKIMIKTDLLVSGMISPEQAKAIALCAVPGQISSGEMESRNGRPVYQITILPTGKQTHSKVDVDAYTGEVLNAKQFGGLRGLAGYLRESIERKENKVKTPQ